MDFKENKLEISLGAVAVLMAVMVGYSLLSSPKSLANRDQDLVYEMPRPKSLITSLFELGDRLIDRQYKNPFEKQKTAVKPIAKIETPKPAETAKKTPAKNANAKVTPLAIAKKMQVHIVQAADKRASFADERLVSGVRSAYPRNNVNSNNETTSTTDDKNIVSGAQWRALLQADPSEANVGKFIAAFNSGEVDEATFQQITTDLLSNNRVEVQKLGVEVLKASYSIRNFVLASQFYNQVQESTRANLHKYLQGYSSTSRLSILGAVLQSNNAAAVEIATQVVIEGYQTAKAGKKPSEDPRSRGDGLISSVTSYLKFVPIFEKLSASPDSAVANLASAALSQLQTSVAAL